MNITDHNSTHPHQRWVICSNVSFMVNQTCVQPISSILGLIMTKISTTQFGKKVPDSGPS
jgi:hypothetical protein